VCHHFRTRELSGDDDVDRKNNSKEEFVHYQMCNKEFAVTDMEHSHAQDFEAIATNESLYDGRRKSVNMESMCSDKKKKASGREWDRT